MAIHAAMVDRMDREIGRARPTQGDEGFRNTVICFLSTTVPAPKSSLAAMATTARPRPRSAASPLPWPAGSVGNTPWRRHKIWVHEGGISTPLIVHWPQGIRARGELRRDVGHVVDFVPTLLELAGAQPGDTWNGVKAPPLPGHSLVPAFAKDDMVKRDFVFFHHSGNRALRVGEWKVVSAKDNQDAWELYDLAKDRSETSNLAVQQPDRAREMAARWQALEAEFRKQAE